MNKVKLIPMNASPADERALQRVLEDAPRFSIAITGKPPANDASHTVLTGLPPGKSGEDKFVFGVSSNDQLVGCVDVVRGYPARETAFIGLLLICEHHHGAGFGAAAYRELERVISDWGSKKIRLAVVQSNPRALGFWERMGFAETGERLPYNSGLVTSQVIPMEKSLRT